MTRSPSTASASRSYASRTPTSSCATWRAPRRPPPPPPPARRRRRGAAPAPRGAAPRRPRAGACAVVRSRSRSASCENCSAFSLSSRRKSRPCSPDSNSEICRAAAPEQIGPSPPTLPAAQRAARSRCAPPRRQTRRAFVAHGVLRRRRRPRAASPRATSPRAALPRAPHSSAAPPQTPAPGRAIRGSRRSARRRESCAPSPDASARAHLAQLAIAEPRAACTGRGRCRRPHSTAAAACRGARWRCCARGRGRPWRASATN